MKSHTFLKAHAAMLLAEIIWGLMAPLGKHAMSNGISGIELVAFRVTGGAILFWIVSLFVKHESISWKDFFTFGLAALFGVTFNQCLFIIGLNYTSPVNASIITTSMPIFAMILAFLIIKEPITWLKSLGVGVGCLGAIILIMSSIQGGSDKVGNYVGDLMILSAQFSFSFYLAMFSKFIKRFSVFTINKWMFLWATIYVLPFSYSGLLSKHWSEISLQTMLEVGYVVVFGTFFSYLFMMIGQQHLRPTIIGVYNYVQPIVAVFISVLMGVGVFTIWQGLAIIFVFLGVWFVIKSKSRKDLESKAAVCENKKI